MVSATFVNLRRCGSSRFFKVGAPKVSYYDPYVRELREFDLRSVDLDSALPHADLVVVVTAHPGIDYGALLERSQALVDLRGVTRHIDAGVRTARSQSDEELAETLAA